MTFDINSSLISYFKILNIKLL